MFLLFVYFSCISYLPVYGPWICLIFVSLAHNSRLLDSIASALLEHTFDQAHLSAFAHSPAFASGFHSQPCRPMFTEPLAGAAMRGVVVVGL